MGVNNLLDSRWIGYCSVCNLLCRKNCPNPMKPKIDQTRVLCTKRMVPNQNPPFATLWNVDEECKTCLRAKGNPVKDGQSWMLPPSFNKGKCPKKLGIENE